MSQRCVDFQPKVIVESYKGFGIYLDQVRTLDMWIILKGFLVIRHGISFFTFNTYPSYTLSISGFKWITLNIYEFKPSLRRATPTWDFANGFKYTRNHFQSRFSIHSERSIELAKRNLPYLVDPIVAMSIFHIFFH
jgi:hypothetical protein